MATMTPAKSPTMMGRRSTDPRPSYIRSLVEANDGPVALAAKIEAKSGQTIFRQQIEQWVKRGWATPYHFWLLMPFAPKGLTEANLYADRVAAKQASKQATKRRSGGSTRRKGTKQ